MKKVRRMLIGSLIVLVILSGLYAFLLPEFTRGMLIRWSVFKEVSPHVFVHPEAPRADVDSLMVLLDSARLRNDAFWGERKWHGNIIYCHTEGLMAAYAPDGNGSLPGAFLFSPIASQIILGPNGLQADIVSHELSHPEFFVRVGWLPFQTSIPVWFYEGLGMQVDNRSYYSESAWLAATNQGKKAPKLTNLESLEQFFGRDSQLTYGTAKREVRRWLSIVGKDGLDDLIEQISWQADFMSLYQQIETAAKLPDKP
ncbi:MAG: hypothetical protein AAF206_26515 [Bacteroidota bacterium]